MTKPIYLDHSATTPVDEQVVAAMLPYWTQGYGNPSSSHYHGREAKKGLEASRRQIADLLGAKPSEIIFTGCGSEADNLALRGTMWAAREAGRQSGQQKNHLITSVIEHEAVLTTAEQLRDQFGFDLTILGVDEHGRVRPQDVANALRPETALVSIMAANNEIGTIQPIHEIGQLVREHGALFHTDAIQALHIFDWNLTEMPFDMLCLAPHKFYGPKGVGIFYLRDGTDLIASMTGGGQEDGRRPGTVNVPFAVGAAKSLELALASKADYNAHSLKLRDQLISGFSAAFSTDEMCLTGHPTERLPHHASFAFNALTGNDLLINLDMIGVSGSSGSACSTGNPEPSHTLEAIGLGESWTRGGLRLTVGKQTTAEDINFIIEKFPTAVQKLKKFTSLHQ